MNKVVPLVLVLLALARPAAAQTPAPRAAGEPAFTTTGAFIAMSVPDLEASVRWYVEKLGMRVVTELPPNDGYAVRILEGGGLIAEIMHTPAASPLRTLAPSVARTTHVHGIFKAGVVVDDYDVTLATLRARGVDIAIGPFPARNGQRANFIVRDNAGNFIQFFGR